MQKIRCLIRQNRYAIRSAAVILLLGGIYLILTLTTPFRIPCPIRALTGLACPGCGITHMVLDTVHLRLLDAIRENYALAILAPIWTVYLTIRLIWQPACLRKNGKFYNVLTWSSLILVLLFGILRNVPGLEFLLPLYMQA